MRRFLAPSMLVLHAACGAPEPGAPVAEVTTNSVNKWTFHWPPGN